MASVPSNSVFDALADGTRRAILAQLAHGEATVMEIAAPFAMSQPAISQHLKVLEEAGLIVRRVEGTKRPCRLNLDGFRPVNEWLDALRDGLSRSYERLDALLAETKTPQAKRKRK